MAESLRTTAAVVLAAATGALAGTVGSFVQAWRVQGVTVGVVLALLWSVGAVLAWSRWPGSRVPGVVTAIAWIAVVVPLCSRRGEGDLVVAGDGPGSTWAYAGMLLVTATCLVTTLRRAAR
ncbi:hypothetical protein EV189_2689 [Motilibacter rhizosphaerae]|uniref:Uncharacterized protein n=1 Tax=Motilibacter rhizosphaerae TaxID=598652 RepID=A0A4Q7NPM5_9ACTN|nr:DUF6113 family protein [Motilibacter rhizosphaerae]RZS87264.1 hypothetical protein EV189_2689 [Motilibacter rhizosphaerae]